MKYIKNMPASVRQRLFNYSKINERPFEEVVQYYVFERFLYRLSLSNYTHFYILKGAFSLRTLGLSKFRPTKDIDMLGKIENKKENIIKHIKDIIAINVEPDGVVFKPDSIWAKEIIARDADFNGVHIRFEGKLGDMRPFIRIDIGFGNTVYPEPKKITMPTILNFPAPVIFCYNLENTIAEKFEAMIKLKQDNSRMKDFYDIWFISHQCKISPDRLTEAIRFTFKQHGTKLWEPIDAFSEKFIVSHQPMWEAFCKAIKQESVPESFQEIVNEVKMFFEPIIKTILNDNTWEQSGPSL